MCGRTESVQNSVLERLGEVYIVGASASRFGICLIAAVALSSHSIAQDPEPTISLLLTLKGHGDSVNAIAFNPNGAVLCTGGSDAQVILWNFAGIIDATNTKAKQIEAAKFPSAHWELNRKTIGERISSVAFDGSGKILAASGVTHWGNGFGASVQVYTTLLQEPFKVGATARWSYTCVAVDAKGRFVAMGAVNDELKVARLLPQRGKNGRITPSLVAKTAPGIPGSVWRVAFHPNRPMVAAGGSGGWIKWYTLNRDGLAPVVTAETPSHSSSGRVLGLKFTPDGRYLVSAGEDKQIKLVELETGAVLHSWKPADATPRHMDLHPIHPWAIVGYSDGIARIVNFESGKIVSEFGGHDGAVESVAFDSDGTHAASGGEDHLIRVWDLGIKSGRRRG